MLAALRHGDELSNTAPGLPQVERKLNVQHNTPSPRVASDSGRGLAVHGLLGEAV